MKKKSAKRRDDDLLPEYDPELIRTGVRGKYAERYHQGAHMVPLAPDVAVAFPDAESVNNALRLLLKIAKSSARAS